MDCYRRELDAGPERALLKLPTLKMRVQLSRSEIYRKVSAGTFPAPIKVGERAVAWCSIEVDAWIQARITDRDARMGARR